MPVADAASARAAWRPPASPAAQPQGGKGLRAFSSPQGRKAEAGKPCGPGPGTQASAATSPGWQGCSTRHPSCQMDTGQAALGFQDESDSKGRLVGEAGMPGAAGVRGGSPASGLGRGGAGAGSCGRRLADARAPLSGSGQPTLLLPCSAVHARPAAWPPGGADEAHSIAGELPKCDGGTRTQRLHVHPGAQASLAGGMVSLTSPGAPPGHVRGPGHCSALPQPRALPLPGLAPAALTRPSDPSLGCCQGAPARVGPGRPGPAGGSLASPRGLLPARSGAGSQQARARPTRAQAAGEPAGVRGACHDLGL